MIQKRTIPKQLSSINPQLIQALAIAFILHGSMLFFTFKRTYDAFVHIFFADHYARAWFDHWEYRWYTGFSMTSYPPGSHQIVALLSRFVGLQNGFIILQIFSVLFVIVGVYRFSRIWVDEQSAGYAALFAVFSSSIIEVVHVFGQSPTIFSLGFLLNALPFVYRWIREGKWQWLLIAWGMNAATTAGHHVTTLFGAVFFVAPVMGIAGLDALKNKGVDWKTKSFWTKQITPILIRCGIYGVGMILLLVLVVLPYWLWSKSDPITQVSIPHSSRDSFIENLPAGLIFWIVPYGVTLLIVPYIVWKGYTSRAWPLILSWTMLFVLGTGGTTPIPKLLLGGAFDILTLDRFTIWATIISLPLIGKFILTLRQGRLNHWLVTHWHRTAPAVIQTILGGSVLLFAMFCANLTQFRAFQPEPIHIPPIVDFIEKDQHDRWRYMTLGFGDQMAWLAANTTAKSVDGNYHSARRLPELTTTPVERLEGAKFRGIPGLGALQQILTIPEKYNLKYIFSNDQFYDPLLYFSGWHQLGALENGVMIWEREDIPPLPEVLPRKEIPMYQRAMWGTFPIGALCIGMTLFLLRKRIAPTPLPIEYIERNGSPFAWASAWLRKRIGRKTIPLLRLFRFAPLLLIIGGIGYLAWTFRQQPVSAEDQLIAYYDDLDFRRFGDAYQRLAQENRPDYELFRLQLSVDGGLVASYAKLDSITTTVVAETAEFVDLEAHTSFVTSLTRYDTVQEHRLWKEGDAWGVEFPSAEISTPPEQFVRKETVDWYAQGKRQVSTETTAFGDVQDRPELQILSAQMVCYGDNIALVGELINTDIDPADVTITGRLFDNESTLLTSYNVQEAMMHKILPKEITPFRIDFEGVAGAIITDSPVEEFEFDPLSFTPTKMGEEVDRYELYAKGVVTSRDLYRGVGVQSLQITEENGTYTLSGEAINSGIQEATIPHLLLTYYDETGAVAWVDDFYLESSIRPQRAISFAVPLTPASHLSTTEITGNSYANILSNGALTNVELDDLSHIIPPEKLGYNSMRVTIHTFTRGQ